MKRFWPLLAVYCSIFGCSKEENIPFIPSDHDSLDVIYYHSINGQYNGLIKDIRWVDQQSYQVLNQTSHSVTVEEVSFEIVKINDISNKIQSNADASMYRLDESGGYLIFNPYSMADSTGVDSVFFSNFFGRQFNGIYYYGSGKLQYFFHFVQKKDTTYQVFEGTLKK